MLSLGELADFAGMPGERLEAMLRRLHVRPESFPDGSEVYEWERLAARLSPSVRERIEKRARVEGISLCDRMDTVAGVPRLAEEWHWKKNGSLKPWRMPRATTRPAWWKCPQGSDHQWSRAVVDRSTHRPGKVAGCPYCAGRLVSKTNCLQTRFPAIARQWHPKKNGQLTPRDIQAGAQRLVWWKCPRAKDHEWQERVGSRTGRARKGHCPFCISRRVVASNNLAVVAPHVAAQWHPSKNGTLTPRDVVPGSGRLVWWRCDNGPDHVWRQSPKARMNGRNCPFCAGKKTSVTNSLQKEYPALAREWHPTKNRGLRPTDVVSASGKRVWWRCRKDPQHEWITTVQNRTTAGGPGEYRPCPFCVGRRLADSNSLATRAPELAAQWHAKKNGKLTPNDVTTGMLRKVWWKCELGHVWRCPVRNRARRGSGCPRCDLMRRRGQLD